MHSLPDTDASPPLRVACDIGGTFTDLAIQTADGGLFTEKLPSTPDDFGRAILDGLRRLCDRAGIAVAQVDALLHASTVATNAILEGKGARTALLTTEGFRDVLELRRIRVPRLYEPLYEKPRPLVPRRLRLEVPERLDADGSVVRPLSEDAVRTLIAGLADEGIEAVAVTLLHSYANPAHERRVGELLAEGLPDAYVSLSVDVLPEIREYERTSTTVVNAYVGPTVRRYLSSLQQRLTDAGSSADVLMMQSSGGLIPLSRVLARPAEVIESGPAAGVIGAARAAVEAGVPDVITFDMGGTTAKASLVEGGRVVRTDEYEVGGGISLSSRLVKGGGYALKLPVIDVSEVGAGGGSLVRVDAAGAVKVGPESAGAAPGPVCYGRGGRIATVTDANVVLGFLNPTALAGGTVSVSRDAACEAIDVQIARPLGLSLEAAALAVHRVASSTMTRAVKAVSTYRGRDPRGFALFAFGGNGGVHGAQLAADLGIRRVLVPPAAGIFSSLGLLRADIELPLSMAWHRAATATDGAALREAFGTMQARLAGTAGGKVRRYRWEADLRYAGQAFELGVPVDPDGRVERLVAEVCEAFAAEHESTYGHRQHVDDVEFVALRVTAVVPAASPVPFRLHALPLPHGERRLFFGEPHGWRNTLVLGRSAVTQAPMAGPLVVEEYEGTTVVPPGATVLRDVQDNLVIDLPAERYA